MRKLHAKFWQINRTGNARCPYEVVHIPSGKKTVCAGIKTLAMAESLMNEELLDNSTWYR